MQFGYAPGLLEKLLALDADILMTHGLWMYPSVVALEWHRRTDRPFIVHPHGMLEAWARNRSRLKKYLAGFFYEKACLRKAASIRALSPSEVHSIRSYGLRNPVCVLPNGIDLPDEKEISRAREGKEAGRKVLLYLGRLHPKKGLTLLLHAWARLRGKKSARADGWRLVIAGWSQDGHEAELQNLALDLKISGSVDFIGPQFHQRKSATYARADAFVLPSLSEGLPMTVLEAWAHRLPVLMTPECHLPEAFAQGAAWCVEPEIGALANGLERFFAMDDASRHRMGELGYQLAATHFNGPAIGAQMEDVCHWILGETNRPACVEYAEEEKPHRSHEPTLA
jgi:glycosyltransferase involved in cell wall biosynthesis